MKPLAAVASTFTALLLLACADKGPPLEKAECRQLLLRQQQVLSIDLRGDDLSDFEASSSASFDTEVNDCVKGRSWTRRGYQCVMAANTQEEMRFCTNRN